MNPSAHDVCLVRIHCREWLGEQIEETCRADLRRKLHQVGDRVDGGAKLFPIA
jgi:hypothetical protein